MSALHNRLKKNEFFKPEAFIDGVWIDTGKTFPVFNPATGENWPTWRIAAETDGSGYRGSPQSLSELAQDDGHRTRNHPEPLVCPHHGKPPFSGANS